MLLLLSNWSFLIVGKLVSKGITTSNPYVIEKGVSFVDLLNVVQYAHNK